MQMFCQTGFYSCPNTGWISCCSNLLLAVPYVIAMIYTFPFILSTHCLMKVWMHHRYDLSDLFFSSSFFSFHFSLNLCLSHMNLVFTPDCQQCQWIQTLAFAVTAFFNFRFPLSWQCSLFGMQEGDCQAAKSYTDKNKGVFLFVSFATLSYPPSHPSSGMIFFSSLFSWSCLHRFPCRFCYWI